MQEITSVTYCSDTIALVENIEKSFLHLGERLTRIQNENLWEGRWTSFAEFLMEIKLSESKASKLIKIYNRFVLEYDVSREKLAKVPWTNLYSFLPVVTDKQKAEEIVERASLMTRQDIEDEVREMKHGECSHEWVKLEKCTNCHKTHKVYDN